MKIKKIWIYLFFGILFFLLAVTSASASYCNETREVIHVNTNNVSSDYNVTITRTCSPEYNNPSFYFTGLVFIFFTALLVVCIFKSSAMWLKSCLAVALSILITSLIRFCSWFVAITNPAETELINTLDHFYMFAVWGIRITIMWAVFVVLIVILEAMKFKKKKKMFGYEKWGDE